MLLKKYISILFLLIGLNGFAQNDTIKITNGVDSNSTQYLTPMEYAFMFHEDTPWMLKAAINSRQSFYLAFERRIKGGFTANISLKNINNLSFLENRNILIANFSMKYYYKMKLRNKSRNTPFNLSGNYFSLGYEVNNNGIKIEKKTINGVEYQDYKSVLSSTYFLKWGMQRRYLKNGFIDAGIRASYNLNGDFNNSLQLHSETSIGLAFAKDKSSLNDRRLCSVIKCFESDRSIFKLNVSNMFGVSTTIDYFSFTLNPEITHEFKLGKSSFSINNTINLELQSSGFNNAPSVYMSYLFESRYYFNLKSRILKGKTGNGLSADYFSLGIYNHYHNNSDIYLYSSINYLTPEYRNQKSNYLQPQLTIGTQRFVGEHFFYDIGFGFRMNNLIDKERIASSRFFNDLIIYNKVGFRF